MRSKTTYSTEKVTIEQLVWSLTVHHICLSCFWYKIRMQLRLLFFCEMGKVTKTKVNKNINANFCPLKIYLLRSTSLVSTSFCPYSCSSVYPQAGCTALQPVCLTAFPLVSAEKPCAVHWRGTAQKLLHWAAGAERTFWHCSISGADWWLQVSRPQTAPSPLLQPSLSPLLPSLISLSLYNLSPLYPWLASIPLWLTGDPHLQQTYRAWQEPNHHHYVMVCAWYSITKAF